MSYWPYPYRSRCRLKGRLRQKEKTDETDKTNVVDETNDKEYRRSSKRIKKKIRDLEKVTILVARAER